MRIDAPAITGSLIVSGSISVSGSLNLNGSNISTQNGGTASAGTISGSTQISALGFVSASVTGSSLISASILSNTITLHKGDQSTLAITLPEGSSPTDISALNTFTASVAGTNVFTASVNTSITALNTYTASATESVVTTTVTSPGGYYIIDGINKPKLSFTPGVTYRFDVSAVPSHPFRFSTTSDGTHNGGEEYNTGVTSGTGFIQIQTGYNTANPLYYYCTTHQNMGNEINILTIGTLSTTASFNSYTQSNEQRVNNINTVTASLAGTNQFTSSISTSVGLLQSTASYLNTTFSSSVNSRLNSVGGSTDISALNTFTASLAGTNAFTASVNTSITSLNAFTTSINTFTASVAGTNTFTASVNTSITSLNAYTASVSTSVGLLQTTASYLNTTFSASVNSRLSINTGSFATTGSNTFIGNQIVTGSLFVSGSLQGIVSTPAWQGDVFLVSSTWSMDFSKSNFFQLQSVEGNNHISASNWKPGQTVSLKINRVQTNMTASFSPAFKFPSGSVYTASVYNSEPQGVEDIITFITYDTDKIYASSVKNMI